MNETETEDRALEAIVKLADSLATLANAQPTHLEILQAIVAQLDGIRKTLVNAGIVNGLWTAQQAASPNIDTFTKKALQATPRP